MKEKISFWLRLLSIVLPFTCVQAQTYDLLLMERGQTVTQTGTETLEAGTGAYVYTASATVTGATPDSLVINSGETAISTFSYPDINVEPLQPYYYDGFDVDQSSFDINIQPGRQGGGDAPLEWLANVEDLVADFHQQVIGPVLLLAGDGSLPYALVSPDLSFTTNWNTTNLGGKKVQAVVDALTNPPAEGQYYSQFSITVASDTPLKQSGTEGPGFSVVLIEDNFSGVGNIIQLWDGDTMLANNIPNPAGSGAATVEIFIDDPDDAHPWDGVGSTVFMVRVQGQTIGRYVKADGGYTNNYITLEGSMQTVGAQLATHTVEDFTVSWGTTNTPSLPETTQILDSTVFGSADELTSAIPAGTYEFISEAGTVGSFTLGNLALPSPQPVKEYDILQFLDSSFDLTLSWEPYTINPAATDAILMIDITYLSENNSDPITVWSAGNTRSNALLSGIDPATTSITIPGGSLIGSPDGAYSINILYADLMTLETDGTARIAMESVQMTVPLQVQPESISWAGYPVASDGQSVNTGTFLGWLDISLADQGWVFNYSLNRYIIVFEEWVSESGGWVFIQR